MQKLQNANDVLPIELFQVASGFTQNFNAPHKAGTKDLGGCYCRKSFSDAGSGRICPSNFSRAISPFSIRWRRRIFAIDAVLTKEPRQRNRPRLSSLKILESLVGNLHIFKVFEVLNDRVSGAVSFRPPRAFSKPLQPLFDFFRQLNGQHCNHLQLGV
jgi:hypothetical protein